MQQKSIFNVDFSHVPLDYLLVCLMEEASEVQKAASKIYRFGLTERNLKELSAENMDFVTLSGMVSQRLSETGYNHLIPDVQEMVLRLETKAQKIVDYYDNNPRTTQTTL